MKKLKIEEINNGFETLVNLQINTSTDEMRLYKIGNYLQDLEINLAVDNEMDYHLLIQVNNQNIIEDKKSEGIHMVKKQLFDEDETIINVIDIHCTMQSLNKLFIYFVHDLIHRINNLSKNENVNVVCLKSLNNWRKMFSREKREILSEEKIIGLWGELFFLRQLINHNPNALDYWIGPEKTKFDFLNGLNAIEVKTSVRVEGRFAEIHGIEQLEPFEGGTLHLLNLKIEKIESGESIPDIIEDITKKNIETFVFLDKLIKIGYEFSLSEKYVQFKYKIRPKEERFYVVDKDFPKITAKSFKNDTPPNSIFKIKYSIDLTGELPAPFSEIEYLEFIKKFVG